LQNDVRLSYRKSLNRMARELGDIGDARTQILMDEDMGAEEKRERLNELRRAHNEIVKQTEAILQKIRQAN
jgi:hypothetical protein